MIKDKIVEEILGKIIENKVTVNKPKVIVLSGLQYSGKSFLAEALEDKNFAHFWATKVKNDYGLSNPIMLSIALEILRSAITKKYNVVIDFVNNKYEDRKKFQFLAESLKAEYNVIFLDISKSKRLKRREINLAKGDMPGRRLISLDQIEEFERSFERPVSDENVIVLSNNDDVALFINSL